MPSQDRSKAKNLPQMLVKIGLNVSQLLVEEKTRSGHRSRHLVVGQVVVDVEHAIVKDPELALTL